jgi:hypothetical protein
MIIGSCIPTIQRRWSSPFPFSASSTMIHSIFHSSTTMTIPITVSVTRSGSEERAVRLNAGKVTSGLGSSDEFVLTGYGTISHPRWP